MKIRPWCPKYVPDTIWGPLFWPYVKRQFNAHLWPNSFYMAWDHGNRLHSLRHMSQKHMGTFWGLIRTIGVPLGQNSWVGAHLWSNNLYVVLNPEHWSTYTHCCGTRVKQQAIRLSHRFSIMKIPQLDSEIRSKTDFGLLWPLWGHCCTLKVKRPSRCTSVAIGLSCCARIMKIGPIVPQIRSAQDTLGDFSVLSVTIVVALHGLK